jgi:hypothetical protein
MYEVINIIVCDCVKHIISIKQVIQKMQATHTHLTQLF